MCTYRVDPATIVEQREQGFFCIISKAVKWMPCLSLDRHPARPAQSWKGEWEFHKETDFLSFTRQWDMTFGYLR